MPDIEARFYTTREIAKLLRVSPSTILSLAEHGRLPQPIRVSDKILRWRASDFDYWLEDAAEPNRRRPRTSSRPQMMA